MQKTDILSIWVYLYKSYHILLGLFGRSLTKVLWRSPLSIKIPWCQACGYSKAWKPSFQYILAKQAPHGGLPTKGKRGEVGPIRLSGNITHTHNPPSYSWLSHPRKIVSYSEQCRSCFSGKQFQLFRVAFYIDERWMRLFCCFLLRIKV